MEVKDLDPQQDLVYVMERIELRGHCRHTVPMKRLRRWARAACRLYGVPNVTIRVYKKRGHGGAYQDGKIQLDPKCGRNGMSLAHELAHHLTDTLTKERSQDHGPTFAYFYGALLHGMRLVPFEGYKAICKKHGIKIVRRGGPKPAA